MLYNFDAANIFLAGKGVDYLDIPSHYILLRYSTYSNSFRDHLSPLRGNLPVSMIGPV